jgi:hypothetical protein
MIEYLTTIYRSVATLSLGNLTDKHGTMERFECMTSL